VGIPNAIAAIAKLVAAEAAVGNWQQAREIFQTPLLRGAVKATLNLILIRIPEINIYSAPVASAVCFFRLRRALPLSLPVGEIFAETRRLRGGYGCCRENRLLVAASMRWLQYGGVAGSAACACAVCGAYSGVQGRDGGGSARLKPYLICICLLPIPKCNMILVARV